MLLLWLAQSAVANTPRVAFIRAPALAPEDAVVTYLIRVPRHPDNRLLVVCAFEADMQVSEMRRELDGVNSAPLVTVRWRLPEGEFYLVAAVYDSERQVGRATHHLTVYAQGP